MLQSIQNIYESILEIYNNISTKSKYGLLIAVIILSYFGFLFFGIKSNQTPNSVGDTKQNQSSQFSIASKAQVDDATNEPPKTVLGYPKNLKKNKTVESAQYNSLLSTGKKNGNIALYNRVNYNIINEKLDFRYSSEIAPPLIVNNNYINPQANLKDSIRYPLQLRTRDEEYGKYEFENPFTEQKGAYIGSIWYASTADLTGTKPVLKQNEVEKGVSIYSKSTDGVTGSTHLKDYIKDNEFKIADRPCKWITFTASEFFCLTTTYQLINLSNNEVISDYVVDITEDNDNNIFYIGKEGVYKANLSDIKNKTLIYKNQTGENPTKISFTNQKELIIHLVFDGSSEIYKKALAEREKQQAESGYTATNSNANLPVPTQFNIEILPDGTSKERPEFKDYIVLL